MKYYLITYYEEGYIDRDDWGENKAYPERIKTKAIDQDWTTFVSSHGIKRILFLKEITEEEWSRAPF